jgi:hypothetical protein
MEKTTDLVSVSFQLFVRVFFVLNGTRINTNRFSLRYAEICDVRDHARLVTLRYDVLFPQDYFNGLRGIFWSIIAA